MPKKKKKNPLKRRNHDILKSFRKEVDMRTKVVRDRKRYQRKVKHPLKDLDNS